MGICNYCGESAGLFRSSHASCKKADEARTLEESALSAKLKEELCASVAQYVRGTSEAETVRRCAGSYASLRYLPSKGFIAECLLELIDREYLACTNPPSQQDEDRMNELMKAFAIEPSALDATRSWTRMVMLMTIRDIDDGKFPCRQQLSGNLPFIFDPGERVAWVFKDANYLVDKVVRTRSTQLYGGISLRVAQGLYVHSGGPLAQTQVSEGLVLQDQGLLCLTDHALYFRGQHKALKIRLRDIVTFGRYNDGFSFCKGAATARDQVFVTRDDEGWFSYTLAKFLAERGRSLQ